MQSSRPTFHNLRASRSGDSRILWSSKTSQDGLWSSKVVKEPVGPDIDPISTARTKINFFAQNFFPVFFSEVIWKTFFFELTQQVCCEYTSSADAISPKIQSRDKEKKRGERRPFEFLKQPPKSSVQPFLCCILPLFWKNCERETVQHATRAEKIVFWPGHVMKKGRKKKMKLIPISGFGKSRKKTKKKKGMAFKCNRAKSSKHKIVGEMTGFKRRLGFHKLNVEKLFFQAWNCQTTRFYTAFFVYTGSTSEESHGCRRFHTFNSHFQTAQHLKP